MSQGNLSIKVVIDPSQFRQELTRLRRDLEDQHRIEMDKFREERREEAYAPTPTVVEIRETITGAPDEGLRKEVDEIKKELGELRTVSRAPVEFGGMTFGDIKRELDALKAQGTFQTDSIFTQPQMDEALSKLDKILDISTRRAGGEEEYINELDPTLNPIRSAMSKLVEMMRRFTVVGGVEGFTGSELDELMSRFLNFEVRGGEGISHKAQKAFAKTVFTAAGKDPSPEYTTYEYTGFRGRGKKRRMTRRQTGRYDIYTPFETDLPGVFGGTVVEAMGGMQADLTKGDQVVRYSQTLLRELFLKAFPARLQGIRLGEEEEPGLFEITEWVRSLIPKLEKAGVEKFLSVGLLGGTSGRDVERYKEMRTNFARAHPAIRLLHDAGLAEFEHFGIPQDVMVDLLDKLAGGEITADDMGTYIAGTIQESDQADLMMDFFNKLNVSKEVYRERIRNAFQGVVDSFVGREEGFTQQEVGDAVTEAMETVGMASDASLTEQREALRDMGALYEPKRRGRRPSTRRRVTRGLRTVTERVVSPTIEHLRRERRLAEEAQVSRLVGAGVRETSEIDQTPVVEGDMTTAEMLQRARIGYVESLEGGGPYESMRRALQEQLDAGDITQEEFDEGMAFVGGPAGSMQSQERAFRDLRKQLFEERSEFTRAGGVGMEYDPSEYTAGMKKVAKSMGLRWDDFMETVKVEEGDRDEFLQGKVGSIMAIIGATVKGSEEAGVLSLHQRKELSKMMSKTPLFWELYQGTPRIDPNTGKPEGGTPMDDFLALVRERVTPDRLKEMEKEMKTIYNTPEINAMINQKDLAGLHTVAIQIKRFERINLDLVPGLGTAIDCWT